MGGALAHTIRCDNTIQLIRIIHIHMLSITTEHNIYSIKSPNSDGEVQLVRRSVRENPGCLDVGLVSFEND